MTLRQQVLDYVKTEYGTSSEHLWKSYPAYHMNKKSWITILLDGTVPFENIKQQIDESYAITASAKEKKKIKRIGPKDSP